MPKVSWVDHTTCDLTFTYKGDLVEHLRTQHLHLEPTKKRKGKKSQPSFASRIVKTQEDIEAQEPHVCPVKFCTSSSADIVDLEDHLQSRHGWAECEIKGLKPSGAQPEMLGRPSPTSGMTLLTAEDLETENLFGWTAGEWDDPLAQAELDDAWPERAFDLAYSNFETRV